MLGILYGPRLAPIVRLRTGLFAVEALFEILDGRCNPRAGDAGDACGRCGNLIGAAADLFDRGGDHVLGRILQVVFLVVGGPMRSKFPPYGGNRLERRRPAARWIHDGQNTEDAINLPATPTPLFSTRCRCWGAGGN